MMLDKPTFLERYILSSVRYESELHNHTVVYSDAYGARPDNFAITYIMHNQQPWVNRSDKPCLVTYNSVSRIDEDKVVKTWWFQHIVHDVKHIASLVPMFRFIQGKRGSWHCGAHTLINSQETCLVSGLAAARQIGADYPFEDDEARRVFNYYGGVMYGWGFRGV